jgi:hypothetical protein
MDTDTEAFARSLANREFEIGIRTPPPPESAQPVPRVAPQIKSSSGRSRSTALAVFVIGLTVGALLF